MIKRGLCWWLLLGLVFPTAAFAATKSSYCYQNPAIGTSVKPNIMLMLDSSGSMGNWAYTGAYDSNRTYYGYAKVDYWYSNSSGKYSPVSACTSCSSGIPAQDGNNHYSGNYLNWLLMDRIDVARKALMGGKTSPRISNNPSSIGAYILEDGEKIGRAHV